MTGKRDCHVCDVIAQLRARAELATLAQGSCYQNSNAQSAFRFNGHQLQGYFVEILDGLLKGAREGLYIIAIA